ncbi:MAG: TolC family protein, partial [Candidatus Margulisbacteria bacterium]|nr:TolC family protein [Candidatus Margulisiibacteriota bacterium]
MKNKILLTAWQMILLAGMAFGITLQESIDIALRENPSVKAAKSNYSAAQTRLYQAAGAFLPSVKLSGNYGQSYTQPSTVQITTSSTTGAVTQTFTFGTDASYNAKSYSAALTQPIFVGALFPGYGMVAKSVDVAGQDYRKAVQDTTFDVTVTYYGVLASKKYIELCKDTLKTAQTHYDQVNTMLNNGVAPLADLLRAEVRVSNAEIALTKAYNTFENAKNAYNNALGIDLNATVEVGEKYEVPKIQAPDLAVLLDTAYKNRPDWLSYILGKKIAEDNIALAKTAYWPTVYLNGTST